MRNPLASSARSLLACAAAALVVLAPRPVRATADFCAVNPVTREGFVFESGEYVGIGWRPVDESACRSFDAHLATLGYAITTSPNRLEAVLVGTLALAGVALVALRAWRRRATVRSRGGLERSQ